ncbi:uncharacterized protein DNG_02814 [Cephalotrichum gorgonifer]|uniref:Uncharacterized protein n=1 Tax=Cephalotrichum gorgonifer TaxID=2041049 RepID=A0AAE8MU66_9PEZI|nr:uncharacterized protein DNG_02814 [Cephalotrichum gorgonifer]
MFYSHEILSNRQYGVATIWWVATIGRRGAAKVITRKAIQEVQINKACETIIDPGAPLALRLQSNLLYGVSRIYSEQCRYVLDDAARVKATMRTFYRQMANMNNEIDPKAGQAAAGKNLIQDDPHFNIDNLAMPNIEFSQVDNLDDFLRQRARASQGSSKLSQLSPGDHSIASSSSGPRDMVGFDFLGSAQSSQRFATPASFGGASNKPLGERLALLPDEDGLVPMDNDLAFAFDADGNLVEMGDSELPPLLGDDPIVPVAWEHGQPGVERQGNAEVVPPEDQFIMNEDPLPDAEALETKALAERTHQNGEGPLVPAPARRGRKPKTGTFLDRGATSLPKSVIRGWAENYAQVPEAAYLKGLTVGPSKAKINAFYLTFGAGIANVGQDMGLQGVNHPLAEFFAGDALRDNVFGVPEIELPRSASAEGSRRRSASEAFDDEVEERRIRRKSDEDEFIFPDGEIALEMGRDANQGVEHHSSAMPWSRQGSNVPGSAAKNVQRNRSASVNSQLARRGAIPDIERFSDPHLPSDNFAGVGLPPSSSVAGEFSGLNLDEGDSQWVRAEVEQAAGDFLAYATDYIQKVGRVEGETGWVEFDKLLVPGRDGKSAAAQGFYHMLSLATRSQIKVKQEGGGREAFGRIEVGIEVGAEGYGDDVYDENFGF